MEQTVQILMSVCSIIGLFAIQMQPAITQMDHLYATVKQVTQETAHNVIISMNVQIAVSVIPMLPALIQKAPTCVLAIKDTLEMVPTAQFSTIAQKQHTVATKTHLAMSLMIHHMMATRLVLARMGSLETALTVLISMNVWNLHATPTQHATTQLDRSCVHVTKVILEME
jgi:hypothetical protein